MVYTTPPTFTGGSTLTASQLNTYLRDNIKAYGEAWGSWSPTLAAWTLGNGTLLGFAMIAGKLCAGRIEYTVGSTDTKSGTLNFPLAGLSVTPKNVNGSNVGHAGLFDTSAANRAFRHVLYGSAGNTLYPTDQTDTRITPTAPWTWATGDQVLIDFLFEIN